MNPTIADIAPAKVYYTIGEVADILKEKTFIVRYWDREFNVSSKRVHGQRRFTIEGAMMEMKNYNHHE